jgi:hypothetical protein
MVPTFNQVIGGPFSTGQPAYRDFFYWIAAFAGQSQNFDGNGYYLRVQPGGGGTLFKIDTPRSGTQSTEKEAFTYSATTPLGVQPQLGGRPPKKPDVRCDRNPVPDLNGPQAQPGPPNLTPVP